MSGYAKSVIFPSSSTLPELVVAFFGGERPELAYKIYVLVSAAAVPWLIALACAIWRVPAGGSAVAVFLALVYIWTDFPISYAAVGMVPYFLGIPLALCATGVFARFLAQGGASNWMLAALLTSLAFLVHLTTAMEIVPAAAMVYLARASRRGAFVNVSILIAVVAAPFIEWVPLTETQLWTIVIAYAALVVVLMQVWDRSARQRAMVRGQGQPSGEPALGRKLTPLGHLTLWAIPVVVLAVNWFWWLPGIWLARTKGPSDFTFKHDEGVLQRLGQIFSTEAPIECVLIAAGLPGMFMLLRRDRILGWACLGFAAAGFAWGYVAGLSRSLDFLQPGRHTYAFYLALAVSAGIMVQELFKRLRAGPHAARSVGDDRRHHDRRAHHRIPRRLFDVCLHARLVHFLRSSRAAPPSVHNGSSIASPAISNPASAFSTRKAGSPSRSKTSEVSLSIAFQTHSRAVA